MFSNVSELHAEHICMLSNTSPGYLLDRLNGVVRSIWWEKNVGHDFSQCPGDCSSITVLIAWVSAEISTYELTATERGPVRSKRTPVPSLTRQHHQENINPAHPTPLTQQHTNTKFKLKEQVFEYNAQLNTQCLQACSLIMHLVTGLREISRGLRYGHTRRVNCAVLLLHVMIQFKDINTYEYKYCIAVTQRH